MDSDRLFGWAKLYNADGTFRLGRTLGNAGLHALMALGCALIVAPIDYFGHFGLLASSGIGAAIGTGAVLLREVVQWATSGSPHLVDRALDLVPAPIGGAIGGMLGWWLASLLLR